ncbi:Hint domain-containing protein [Oceaniglobus roseus]|uniref:Hint domain-containing protein n=1 Tax=Oceaniglobus roseus TaxID=1737570 RepID=UPI000C7F3C38|nr:Hint domain-containing protein [Kandeliimicrobium roseum]
MPAFGLTAGTRVATATGWRPVEAVTVGDRVLTFDAGLQLVTAVERVWFDGTGAMAAAQKPLRVPPQALGNHAEMVLLPDQPVIFEADCAEELFGDPFALLPAAALEGYRGIERFRPVDPLEIVSLSFESDQVVFANLGALFFCPVRTQDAGTLIQSGDTVITSPYTPLPMDIAEALVSLAERDARQARQV